MATAFWNGFGISLQPLLKVADELRLTGKTPPRPAILPRPHTPMEASSKREIDELLARLDAKKDAWAATECADRVPLLDECLAAVKKWAGALARVGTAAKGSYEGAYGDEMATVLPIVSALYEYKAAMAAGGAPRPEAVWQRPDGQWVARVWPANMVPAFFPRFSGEIWVESGKEPTQGRIYRDKAAGGERRGSVSLVLGAGNQLPVVALDILHMLFAEDRVVLVKMNPVNDYYGPLLKQAFGAFASRGFLEFVYGGADVGAYCVAHRLVSSVHLTGSEATYNAIMFGAAKPSGAPRLSKPVTAELGNVTPYIVVPGPWSAADIEYHATNVASGLAQNTGHNCIAAEVIITDASWPQREQFLQALTRCLDNLQQRGPWYPGSTERLAAFKRRFPKARVLGRPPPANQAEGCVPAQPWMLATGLSSDEAQTREENWGGVLQEVAMAGCSGTDDFIRRAVDYANERCWGTLAASIFIHPETQRRHAGAYEAAVAALRYGCVTVNCPSTVGFSATPLVWGAFPGHTPQDIGSGVGFVHNTYLLDHPQKGVLRAPWRYSPAPLWSVGQIGLGCALPWAFKYLTTQHNPPLALCYLVMVAWHALRGSWPVASARAPVAS